MSRTMRPASRRRRSTSTPRVRRSTRPAGLADGGETIARPTGRGLLLSTLDLGPGLDPVDERHAVVAAPVEALLPWCRPERDRLGEVLVGRLEDIAVSRVLIQGGDLSARLRIGRRLAEVVGDLCLHFGTGDVV